MNFNLDEKLLEKMSEGVILLNRMGKVIHFNHAASPWLNHAVIAEARLRKTIAESFKIRSASPVVFELFVQNSADASPVEVFLCGSDTPDFALFITGKTAPITESKESNKKPDFLTLLSKNIQNEMLELGVQLETIKATTNLPSQSPIVQRVNRVHSLISIADQLSKLNEFNVTNQSDRVSLMSLINDVLNDIPHLRAGFTINESLSGHSDQQGMLFGNKEWLKCGLRALLEGMGESAPPRTQVELRVRQSGGFVVMTGGFIQAAGMRKVTNEKLAASTATSLAMPPEIRDTMAHRIIELHGGVLKILYLDGDQPDAQNQSIESFILQLPTGRPIDGALLPSCVECPYYKQTELYANDLAVSMM